MNLHSIEFWIAIGATLLTSTLMMPLMMRLARILGIMDVPAHRKIHREPIPYLGGLGVAIAVTIGAFLGYLLVPDGLDSRKIITLLSCYWLITLLGIADDKLQMRARLKFLFQVAVAIAFSMFFYHFNTLTLPGIPPITLGILAPVVTVFWITSILNALNMIDGVDGLCASTSISTLSVIAVLAWCVGDPTVLLLASLGVAAALGFLFYNWRPARIYLGDAGSLGLAAFNAVLLISLGSSAPHTFKSEFDGWEPFSFHLPLATLILAYPAMEIGLSVTRRFLKGKPIGSADKEHIHHLLLHKGWTAQQICLAAIVISLLMGGVAIASVTQHRGIASWLLAAGALLIGIGASYAGIFEMFHISKMRVKRINFLIANHFMNMQKLKLDLTHSVDEVFALINQTCTELGVEKYSVESDAASNEEVLIRFNWSRPSDAHGFILSPLRHSAQKLPFSDRRESSSSRTLAEWSFEQVESEDDLDVEYRVLFSDFMEKALDRTEECLKESSTSLTNIVRSSDLSANTIRRRGAGSDSTQTPPPPSSL